MFQRESTGKERQLAIFEFNIHKTILPNSLNTKSKKGIRQTVL